jgi:thiamine pyrophosphate-dependent acetolactate synthase large subunit-like protein
MHGGDRIAAALEAHGVQQIFTLCGGHISPILSGARARGIRVIDVRDEATAVFAADAVARLGRSPGVAAVTAGPGLTNTITAVKNAQLAQSPVVLLGGAAPTVLQGRGALQDIDQMALMVPHVKLARRVRAVRDLAPAIEQACATARSGVPGPVFVECPIDLLYPETSIREMYGAARGGRGLRARLANFYLRHHLERMFAGSGAADELQPIRTLRPPVSRNAVIKALRELESARRPVLVAGSQTLAEPEHAGRIAEAVTRLGMPTWLSGMARGLLGADHPLQMRHQRRAALREADCVLLAGVPNDFRLDYGRHIRGSATVIALNRSIRDATRNRRPDVLLLGDVGAGLEALAERLIPTAIAQWTSWIESLRARDEERERDIESRAQSGAAAVNPLALFKAIDVHAEVDSVYVADGGDFVGTAAYILRPRKPLSWLDPGAFGTLGVGAGFSIGARCRRPDAEIWLILGDGAAGYGLVEFDTLVRHGLPVIAVVGNDGGWTQIAREQVKILGDDVATVLDRSAYHDVARAFGAAGLLLERDADIEAVITEAKQLAAGGRPVLINAMLARTDFRDGSLSM